MRVIIADDELHARRRLAEKIDWKQMGVESIELCSDGDEILEVLETSGADLVITDIRMPRMDGIQAIREARKHWPDLMVILMSAYDDKEYLKSALDLRVIGYLEKPFRLVQVKELLEKAMKIASSRKHAETAAMQQHKQAIRAAAASLCQYQSDYKEPLNVIRENCSEFAQSDIWCAVLIRRKEEELDGMDEGVDLLCEKLLEEQKWCGICAGMKRGCAVVLFAADAVRLRMILQKMYHLLVLKANGDWIFAAGSETEQMKGIYDSYQDAVITMERHFYHQIPVLYFDAKKIEPLHFSREEQDSFEFALQSHNAPACLSYLDGLKRSVCRHDTTLVRVTKNHYFQLALLIMQNRPRQGMKISEYYLWELFYQATSLEELHGFLVELLTGYMPEEISGHNDSRDIASILEYINKNLQNPGLSLSDISRAYYMSVTYLCMYFKEKTGTTIRSYIIESRMKKAAELLQYTDLKVTEIAEAVGFTNQSYFTKSFGRYFGMSPSRYKEEHDSAKK